MGNSLDKVVVHFGGQHRLAGALNVSSAAVHYWVKDGYMPPFRAIQIEQMTRGAFLAVDLVKGSQGIKNGDA